VLKHWIDWRGQCEKSLQDENFNSIFSNVCDDEKTEPLRSKMMQRAGDTLGKRARKNANESPAAKI
jgi:hypothetical protein